MAQPTLGIFFAGSSASVPPGDQAAQPLTEAGGLQQAITFVPQRATAALCGTVRPDGSTITIADDGTISAVAGAGGGVGGGGGSSTSASGGALVCVTPQGSKDGSNVVFTLPAPVLAGTTYVLVRNGVIQRQFGTSAEFAVSGNQITYKYPPKADDWHEFYYVMGTPDSETSGGGSVTPAAVTLRASGSGFTTSGSSVTVTIPAGAQAGDFAVFMVAHCYPITSTPSGWTQISAKSGTTWSGAIYTKTLTSGDISGGSVTVNASNSQFGAYAIAVFIGATGGVREFTHSNTAIGYPSSPVTLNTTSAVIASDMALYFASIRNSSFAFPVLASRGGTALQTATDSSDGDQTKLFGETYTAPGPYSVVFSVSGGLSSDTELAIVVVKA